MCTVVVRWSADRPAEILALRDELVGRAFDDPGRWWPEQPTVVGGRDRVAGGSWCVTDVETGTTALVLNRPQRRQAAEGAASRGVLPLLAVAHGDAWREHVELTGMASFALVLVGPGAVTLWVFDGEQLSRELLPEGTHMVTSGGAEDGKAGRFLADFASAPVGDWPGLVARQQPQDDPAALVVHHPFDGGIYATVFGQTIQTQGGRVAIDYSRTPWLAGTWTPASVEP